MVPRPRPLSPHLQVYRPQLTSVMSIFHRITGMALTFGIIALVLWLTAIAMGPEWYLTYHNLVSHFLGRLILMGISFSYCYHFLNGIRHLVWDSGHGFELKTVYRSGYTVLGVSTVATLLIWTFIFTG
jgi:succinate dehydrogenase / fumarate reductase cytochrome b subunit